MPVWHAKTKAFVASGEIVVVGIVQEQHAERARLFMQWQQIDWPILVDSYNVLGVGVVPITALVNADGSIHKVPARLSDLESWTEGLHSEPNPVSRSQVTVPVLQLPEKLAEAEQRPTQQNLDQAIESLTQVETPNGLTQFQLGVAYRKRFDSAFRQQGDFANAVRHWQAALETQPNQYIWRRRIQQYGPLLDKPYPFYDWVDSARREIKNRGEEPAELSVPLAGAETASPRRPDEGEPAVICQETQERILPGPVNLTSVGVPSTQSSKPAIRLHLRLEPDNQMPVKWNDEAGPPQICLENSPAASSLRILPATDSGPRKLELELRYDKRLPATITGSVLYNVCIGDEQQCVLRRSQFSVQTTNLSKP